LYFTKVYVKELTELKMSGKKNKKKTKVLKKSVSHQVMKSSTHTFKLHTHLNTGKMREIQVNKWEVQRSRVGIESGPIKISINID